MYLLNKVFQLRDHVNPEHEKPFLDHLEDLRVMVFKVAVTLILSMIVCFVFQKNLMDILRRPVDQVLVNKSTDQLRGAPRPLSVTTWEKAKQAEHAAASLDPVERVVFYQSLKDPEVQYHLRVAAIQRAALALPEDHRKEFLKNVTADQAIRDQVNFLIERKATPESSAQKDSRMMSALKPTETFMLSMKLAFFAGIILAFPLLLMFILQFVLPGLHQNERKLLWPGLTIGFGLFLAGVVFSYFIVLPKALEFFYDYSLTLGVSNEWRIGEYISFATQFTLLFGLAYELPVVVMIIVKLGLLSYSTMKSTRRYAIVAIVVLAAVLTPTPDPLTQFLMAAPMYLLYEICIWLAWASERKAKKQEEAEDRERMNRLLRDYEEHEGIQAEVTAEKHDDGWTAETPDYHSDHETPTETTEPPEIADLGSEKPASPPTYESPNDEKRPSGDA